MRNLVAGSDQPARFRIFIEQLRTVLLILGFDLFRPAGGRVVSKPGADEHSPVFELDTVGVRATAREPDDGFVVLAGSTARQNGTDGFPDEYRSFRGQLVKDGKLVDGVESSHFRFAANVMLSNLSAAAAVVMVRAASGPQEWELRGTGQTYKAWRAAILADHGGAQ